jgi:hypothetical protein
VFALPEAEADGRRDAKLESDLSCPFHNHKTLSLRENRQRGRAITATSNVE